MKAPPEPVYLARGTYRRRRLVDAVRALPFAGLFLFLLPVLWGEGDPVGTAWGGIYVFAIWFALIAVSAVLSRLIDRGVGDDGDGDG